MTGSSYTRNRASWHCHLWGKLVLVFLQSSIYSDDWESLHARLNQ